MTFLHTNHANAAIPNQVSVSPIEKHLTLKQLQGFQYPHVV